MTSTPNQSQQKFWNQLLGESLNKKLEEDPASYLSPSTPIYPPDYNAFKDYLENAVSSVMEEEYFFLKKEIFGGIYCQIISAFVRWKEVEWKNFPLLEQPSSTFIRIFYERIKEIPVRVCVFEMQSLKQQGTLQGEDDWAEYEWFCKTYLEDSEYVKELYRKYPEMLRLFFVRLNFTYQYLIEFFKHLEDDLKYLENGLYEGKHIFHIKNMTIGGSDSHNEGKAVIRFELENGQGIIYKPHSLQKESIYQELFGEFCRRMDMESFRYCVYDRGDYGWEECLKDEACGSQEEVKRCYKRMGIHLFLCMLLNGTDMHQENILVVGEHPVILDMETIPGIKLKQKTDNAEERIEEMMRESVMKAGILPVPSWKAGEKAVVLSALYQDEELYSSVKVPVFVDPKTSRMHIEYRHIKMKRGKSLPVCQGEKMYPVNYIQELCEGFSEAYRLWMKERRELETQINQFWDYQIRFLVRHTQQYSMYLFTSLHPMFLSDTNTRIKMLQVLQKGDTDRKYAEKEMESLFQLDVPMFECRGRELVSRFHSSAYECFLERAGKCGEEDLRRQLSHIRLSVEMADPENRYNHYFLKPDRKADKCRLYRADAGKGKWKEQKKEHVKKAIDYVLHSIKEMSVSEGKDVGWMNLHCEGAAFWQLTPADVFLYDGISGIAVFLAFMDRCGLLKDRELYEQTVQKLFSYTDKIDSEETRTGLLVGEGSVAYAYLLMYQITGEERFAEFAKKHARKIESLYQSDREWDLLSGNAGAIVLLTNMYEVFHEEEWLHLAIAIGDWLWDRAEKQETGCGWKNKDTNMALAGMAHGNSGFLLAYGGLLEHTKRKKYKEIIEELLAYENSLYSQRAGNWRDMRYPQMEAYSNAWCHGAAGILLSRLKMASLDTYKNREDISKDIRRASDTLFTQSERNGLCICHGMAGNYRIMAEYAKYARMTEEQKDTMSRMEEKLIDLVEKGTCLLPQDRYKPGLMTGMAGIGCILGMIYEKEVLIP